MSINVRINEAGYIKDMPVKDVNDLLVKYSSFVNKIEPLDGLVGRKEELRLLSESQFKKRMKNTILVGSAGCGKTAIIRQFVHDKGFAYHIVNFDVAGCLAGTRYRGEFEEKLHSFLEDASTVKDLIVVIDEIQMIVGCGETDGGACDCANILKPYLSDGKVTIIGATTTEEYKKMILKDKALNRRLSPIFIRGLDFEAIKKILIDFGENLIDEELAEYIYDLSLNLKYASNPDTSLEILDRCLARYKAKGKTINKKMIKEIVNYMTMED